MVFLASNFDCPARSTDEHQSLPGIIASMPSITLEEMDSVQLMDRVDTKFVLREERLCELFAAVAELFRVLDVQGVRDAIHNPLL